MTSTLAVDFDGVVHDYDYWRDGDPNGRIAGRPIPGAMAALAVLAKHYEIVIFSVRAAAQEQPMRDWMDKFMAEAIPPVHFDYTVTDRKPQALAYIDDRAIRFTNWADVSKYFV